MKRLIIPLLACFCAALSLQGMNDEKQERTISGLTDQGEKLEKPTYEACEEFFRDAKTADDLELFVKKYGLSPEKLADLLGACTLGDLAGICDIESKVESRQQGDHAWEFDSPYPIYTDHRHSYQKPLVFVAFDPSIADRRPSFSQTLASALKKLPTETKYRLLRTCRGRPNKDYSIWEEIVSSFRRSPYLLEIFQDLDYQMINYAWLVRSQVDYRGRTPIHWLLCDTYSDKWFDYSYSFEELREQYRRTALPLLRLLLNPIVLKEAVRNKAFGKELATLKTAKDRDKDEDGRDDKTVFDLAKQLSKYDGRKRIMAKLADAIDGFYIDIGEADIAPLMCERLKQATNSCQSDVKFVFDEE